MSTNGRTATDGRRWEIRRGHGPVMATAVHAGHLLRPDVAERTALDDGTRLREEDPMTDVLATVGDQVFVSRTSRFEVDLNRPTDEAVYRIADDAWGLEPWKDDLPDYVVNESLAEHELFYEVMGDWIEEMIDEHGTVLLLDVHSFNHRRADGNGRTTPAGELPDIDLGLSTADRDRFGSVVDALWSELSASQVGGRDVDVRENVRFPDGGHWPEWVFAEFGDRVCTITLEYKKTFMDEWTGQADVAELLEHHAILTRATAAARGALR